jgi:hypothetical protein
MTILPESQKKKTMFDFLHYPIKIMNSHYQNDRSDRGIISWFYRKNDFIVVSTSQTSSWMGGPPLSGFNCK